MRTNTRLGTPPAVLCHISHVYPAGASLYFTVACAQLEDPIAQWEAAKAAAGEAILAQAARSPTTMASGPITATSCRGRWARWASRCCARSSAPSTRPGSSTPGSCWRRTAALPPPQRIGNDVAMTEAERFTTEMATLAVRLGANVQPGQIVSVSSEPGKEAMARAVAEAAYAAGAKFVDLTVFDVYFRRARALNAQRDTLGYVPPWLGERVLALGEHRAARISLSGPVAPHALDDVDPELISLDRLPRVPEAMKILNDATTNWTIVPCPTPAWASLVYPRLEPPAALERLWSEIAHVTRLDEPDPVAAWRTACRSSSA